MADACKFCVHWMVLVYTSYQPSNWRVVSMFYESLGPKDYKLSSFSKQDTVDVLQVRSTLEYDELPSCDVVAPPHWGCSCMTAQMHYTVSELTRHPAPLESQILFSTSLSKALHGLPRSAFWPYCGLRKGGLIGGEKLGNTTAPPGKHCSSKFKSIVCKYNSYPKHQRLC